MDYAGVLQDQQTYAGISIRKKRGGNRHKENEILPGAQQNKQTAPGSQSLLSKSPRLKESDRRHNIN
jgi:hypothetical protein